MKKIVLVLLVVLAICSTRIIKIEKLAELEAVNSKDVENSITSNNQNEELSKMDDEFSTNEIKFDSKNIAESEKKNQTAKNSNHNKNKEESSNVTNCDQNLETNSKIKFDKENIENKFSESNSDSNSSTPQNPSPTDDDSKKEVVKDPFYSIHHGNIEFKTKQLCENASMELGFLDTVDIKNLGCFEIISKENVILGYYLKVYCESGNCERYKSMIDLSKFK